MTSLAIDRRLADFMDKWRQTFKSDSDLMTKSPKTDEFFVEATELYQFLLARDGRHGLRYALRYLASIPGVTAGLKQVFSEGENEQGHRPM
ncbi:MAG: hypothetical protein M3Q07_00725 [Pseudobdellovibrionaceae bacterium]|uniref:hypothetical protein n=1 Tax=Oligoflexus sp. TaxID=1971216 RepID=UPI0027C6E198|nr:hypothetical protein [Oligoflexus sp.]MDQ3230315.1 hypothetical protein [Pseudobdellovibrionaceae bacterium]HYX37699.1 hypothetical protein [Oligoflexus sp.]